MRTFISLQNAKTEAVKMSRDGSEHEIHLSHDDDMYHIVSNGDKLKNPSRLIMVAKDGELKLAAEVNYSRTYDESWRHRIVVSTTTRIQPGTEMHCFCSMCKKDILHGNEYIYLRYADNGVRRIHVECASLDEKIERFEI